MYRGARQIYGGDNGWITALTCAESRRETKSQSLLPALPPPSCMTPILSYYPSHSPCPFITFLLTVTCLLFLRSVIHLPPSTHLSLLFCLILTYTKYPIHHLALFPFLPRFFLTFACFVCTRYILFSSRPLFISHLFLLFLILKSPPFPVNHSSPAYLLFLSRSLFLH